ncbi:RHS repeat-associated core domain-containing protein [Actinoplanes sp. NBRC 101535]|uniref:RHS repeat-associated core domain-containing protein n=1 Tax=Actinoplanes sp. NBRC 101535 TaxID=3032196 RepID=UPI0024A18307|nr:RHS repeat-associated core domain-containing protein [Actinoplanes sp. NBRC 101535]GLY00664.1 hypothetical protein Acsp01_10430 [Actinoplanes sp. NBRC 101535]
MAIDATTQESTVRRQTPYGTERGATSAGAWPNNRGFVGGVIDNTGLIHLGAREYDPTLGRFISVDPIQDMADPQQWNGYAYANNTPITMSDPTGLLGDTGDGSGNGVRFVPETGNIVDPGKYAGHPTGGKKNHGNVYTGGGTSYSLPNGTTVSTDFNGRRTINGIVPRAKGPDIDALAAGVDRARADYQVAMCDYTCESDVFDMIQMACGLEYVQCSAQYTALTQWDRTVAMCVEVGVCGDGDIRATHHVRAANKIIQDKERADSCYFRSFSADTRVLLADGTSKRFDELEVADEVLATNPVTGEQGPRQIEAIWIHEDDLYELTIDGETITTTEDHQFWNQTHHRWQDAQELDEGDRVHTPSGLVAVDYLDIDTHHYGDAYNLTIAGLHTYYVLAGITPVLAHNTGGCVNFA